MKRELPPAKFEELMNLARIDGMPHHVHSEHDDENEMHEEGLNEILTSFFGDGNSDEGDDPMHNINDDIEGNCHHKKFDDINIHESIKQAAKTVVFKLGASRTSKLSCTLILLEIKSLFGWSDKSFTTLLKYVELYL